VAFKGYSNPFLQMHKYLVSAIPSMEPIFNTEVCDGTKFQASNPTVEIMYFLSMELKVLQNKRNNYISTTVCSTPLEIC